MVQLQHWLFFKFVFILLTKYQDIIYTKYHLFSLYNVQFSLDVLNLMRLNFVGIMDFEETAKLAKFSPIEKFSVSHSWCNGFRFEPWSNK